MEEGGCTRSSHNPSFARAEGTERLQGDFPRRIPSAIINGISSDIGGTMDLTFARTKQRLEKYRGKNIIFKREYLERNSIHFVATILINLGLFF